MIYIEKYNEIYERILKISKLLFYKYENIKKETFNDAFRFFNGFAFKSKDYIKKSKNKLITIKNIDEYGFNTNNVSYLYDYEIFSKYKLNVGDILLTMTGNIGRFGIVDEDNCFLNQRVLKIISASKLYTLCFLEKYKDKIMLLGKGTAQINLSLNDLKKLYVYNTKEEIEKFKKFDYLFDLILKYKLIIKSLLNIKEKLLIKFFN